MNRLLDPHIITGVRVDENLKEFVNYENAPEWTSDWDAYGRSHEVFEVDSGIIISIFGDVSNPYTDLFYDAENLSLRINDYSTYFSDNFIANDDVEYKRKIYNEYLTQIGDTSYNMQNKISQLAQGVSMINSLKSIDITCEKDFDNMYPAGSDLNELFTVYFDDPYITVKNGYKQVEGTLNHTIWGTPAKDGPYSVVQVKLSEVNFEDRPFITPYWYFSLNSTPEETGEYIFKIKFTLFDGTILETIAPAVNIQGSKK